MPKWKRRHKWTLLFHLCIPKWINYLIENEYISGLWYLKSLEWQNWKITFDTWVVSQLRQITPFSSQITSFTRPRGLYSLVVLYNSTGRFWVWNRSETLWCHQSGHDSDQVPINVIFFIFFPTTGAIYNGPCWKQLAHLKPAWDQSETLESNTWRASIHPSTVWNLPGSFCEINE